MAGIALAVVSSRPPNNRARLSAAHGGDRLSVYLLNSERGGVAVKFSEAQWPPHCASQ